jgi:hypothetical protein
MSHKVHTARGKKAAKHREDIKPKKANKSRNKPMFHTDRTKGLAFTIRVNKLYIPSSKGAKHDGQENKGCDVQSS